MGYISSNIFVCLKMGFVPQHCCSESGKLRTCDEEQLSNGFSSTLRNFQSNPYYPIVIQWGFQQQQRWIKPDIPGKAGYRTDGNAAEWSAPKEFQAVRCQDHVSIVQSRATWAIEIERWQKQTLDLPFFHEQELNTYSQSKISVFGGWILHQLRPMQQVLVHLLFRCLALLPGRLPKRWRRFLPRRMWMHFPQ